MATYWPQPVSPRGEMVDKGAPCTCNLPPGVSKISLYRNNVPAQKASGLPVFARLLFSCSGHDKVARLQPLIPLIPSGFDTQPRMLSIFPLALEASPIPRAIWRHRKWEEINPNVYSRLAQRKGGDQTLSSANQGER